MRAAVALPDGVGRVGGAVHVSYVERLEQQCFVLVGVQLEDEAHSGTERHQADAEAAHSISATQQCVVEVERVRQPGDERRDLDEVDETDRAGRVDREDEVAGEMTSYTTTTTQRHRQLDQQQQQQQQQL